jgi:hypothetical protein
MYFSSELFQKEINLWKAFCNIDQIRFKKLKSETGE